MKCLIMVSTNMAHLLPDFTAKWDTQWCRGSRGAPYPFQLSTATFEATLRSEDRRTPRQPSNMASASSAPPTQHNLQVPCTFSASGGVHQVLVPGQVKVEFGRGPAPVGSPVASAPAAVGQPPAHHQQAAAAAPPPYYGQCQPPFPAQPGPGPDAWAAYNAHRGGQG